MCQWKMHLTMLNGMSTRTVENVDSQNFEAFTHERNYTRCGRTSKFCLKVNMFEIESTNKQMNRWGSGAEHEERIKNITGEMNKVLGAQSKCRYAFSVRSNLQFGILLSTKHSIYSF